VFLVIYTNRVKGEEIRQEGRQPQTPAVSSDGAANKML